VKVLSAVVVVLFGMAMTKPLLAAELTAAEQLSAQLKPMHSLIAHFQQTIRDVDGVTLQQASGTLTVKRPRQFYWRTEQPYEHLVVTDGSTLWLYDIDLEQISKQAFDSDLDKAPALLLSGEIEAINKQYTVVSSSENANSQRYLLTPNKADALFRELTVVFIAGTLSSMSLRDSFDQQTIIEFTAVSLNPAVADSLFDFTPPAGVDVIADEF
jgi:outer membrane lipoprotein carrier protein